MAERPVPVYMPAATLPPRARRTTNSGSWDSHIFFCCEEPTTSRTQEDLKYQPLVHNKIRRLVHWSQPHRVKGKMCDITKVASEPQFL